MNVIPGWTGNKLKGALRRMKGKKGTALIEWVKENGLYHPEWVSAEDAVHGEPVEAWVLWSASIINRIERLRGTLADYSRPDRYMCMGRPQSTGVVSFNLGQGNDRFLAVECVNHSAGVVAELGHEDADVWIEDEEMALTGADKTWISEEIRKAVESLKPRGFAYLLFWVQKLGAPLAAIAVVVALAGITFGAVYQSFGHVKEETEFRTRTTDTLVIIQADLREMKASQSPAKVFKEIASLPPKEFIQNLPALRKVAEQSPEEVAASIPLLHEVAVKLSATNEGTLDYWPTVLQFIRFASSGSAQAGVPPAGPPNYVFRDSDVTKVGPLNGLVVMIDGGSLLNLRIENSRVIFTGNPVRMQNVTFINCVFELPVSNTPPPFLKKAAQQLLASNFTSISRVQ